MIRNVTNLYAGTAFGITAAPGTFRMTMSAKEHTVFRLMFAEEYAVKTIEPCRAGFASPAERMAQGVGTLQRAGGRERL